MSVLIGALSTPQATPKCTHYHTDAPSQLIAPLLSNRDGLISRGEFKALLEEWRLFEPESFWRVLGVNNAVDAARLFNRFDTTGAGFLSRASFLQLVRAESSRRGAPPCTQACRPASNSNPVGSPMEILCTHMPDGLLCGLEQLKSRSLRWTYDRCQGSSTLAPFALRDRTIASRAHTSLRRISRQHIHILTRQSECLFQRPVGNPRGVLGTRSRH